MFIVLIVGCIPPSRPFFAAIFKGLSIRQLYTSDGNTRGSQRPQSYKLKSQTWSRPTNAQSAMDDNDSEEGILTDDRGITVTTEFTVSHDAEAGPPQQPKAVAFRSQ